MGVGGGEWARNLKWWNHDGWRRGREGREGGGEGREGAVVKIVCIYGPICMSLFVYPIIDLFFVSF